MPLGYGAAIYGWKFVTDISGQRSSPIFKGQAVQEERGLHPSKDRLC